MRSAALVFSLFFLLLLALGLASVFSAYAPAENHAPFGRIHR